MKRKYNGLIAMVIIGVILLPTAIYAVYSSQIPVGIGKTRSPTFASGFIVPDAATMKKLSVLETKMVDMANPTESKSALDHDIRFWRYSDQNYHRYPTKNQREEMVDGKTSYALTFTFASNEKKFCIIDGSFYAQGAELPGGGKIVEIKPGRVLVKKGESAQWISLSETTQWGEIQ
jgi:hypothetical protein